MPPRRRHETEEDHQDEHDDEDEDWDDEDDEDEPEFQVREFRPYDGTLGKFVLICGLTSILIVPFFWLLGILWRWWTLTYRLGEENITVRRQFLSERQDNLRYRRIRDLRMQRSLLDRICGTGSIVLVTFDATDGVLVMQGVPDVHAVYQDLKDRRDWA